MAPIDPTSTFNYPRGDLIRERTSGRNLGRIDRKTRGHIEQASRESPEQLRRRLRELDREWDVNRALMANFAVIGGLSATLAMRGFKRRGKANFWTWFFATQVGFLLHHAWRGWCPPLPVFRRLGFRTAREIEMERDALETLLPERDGA